MAYLFVAGTILLTVYGQIVIKWRVMKYGDLPDAFLDKAKFLVALLFDPYIVSGLAAALIAGLLWMAAMTKLDLSHAYPFMGSTFVLVLLFSGLFLHETITLQKLIGVAMIIAGITISVK